LKAADIATEGSEVDLGGTNLTLCPSSGAIVGLTDRRGVGWASPRNPMALFEYVLYTNDQMAQVRADYCPHGCNPKEFGKPGMPLNTSVSATPSDPMLWLKKDPATGAVMEAVTMAVMDHALNIQYGAPAQVKAKLYYLLVW